MKDFPSVPFTLFSTIYLSSFKFKVIGGCDNFRDVIREMKSNVKQIVFNEREVFLGNSCVRMGCGP